ncbi:MAG: kinase/pyrophosphorylase [Deltaproteobacteria bacterium]|nr:kinase/pyrophosphorylase [Deltaproteobacteria bacterium]
MTQKRTVFFVSDRTAITAVTLGESLLTQFDNINFEQATLPFIDTTAKAKKAVREINRAAVADGQRPIIFSTLIDPEIRRIVFDCAGLVLDFFETFISRLEKELSTSSAKIMGRYHAMTNTGTYDVRINAVNYALANDDGISLKNFNQADLILIGVSRTGKTPTCLYLALQFGIFAANYPLTEELFSKGYSRLPESLFPFRKKLFGLNINPERLQAIREKRRPDSNYSSFEKCRMEVAMAKSIFISERIPYLNVTAMSVEEIATKILHEMHLARKYT